MPSAMSTAKLGVPPPFPDAANHSFGEGTLRYGSAVRASHLDGNSRLAGLIRANCAWVTPEIDMKWDVLQPAHGRWNFKPADTIVRFARQSGMGVRGHTLLWDQSTPRWVRNQLSDKPDWTLIRSHFQTVLSRYDGQVCEWDVVNEPIDTEHGTQGIRRNVFQRAFGNGYIAKSLREAKMHAPNARLVINEYSLEYGNPVDRERRVAMLKLVESLLAEGAPIDAVGIQAHLDLSKGELAGREITRFLREIEAMGLEATITELDVRESNVAAPVELRDRRVADHVRRYLDIVLAEPVVRGVVTWGLSDGDSWLNPEHTDTPRGFAINRGLPYDDALRPKPLHWEIQGAFQTHGGERA